MLRRTVAGLISQAWSIRDREVDPDPADKDAKLFEKFYPTRLRRASTRGRAIWKARCALTAARRLKKGNRTREQTLTALRAALAAVRASVTLKEVAKHWPDGKPPSEATIRHHLGDLVKSGHAAEGAKRRPEGSNTWINGPHSADGTQKRKCVPRGANEYNGLA